MPNVNVTMKMSKGKNNKYTSGKTENIYINIVHIRYFHLSYMLYKRIYYSC